MEKNIENIFFEHVESHKTVLSNLGTVKNEVLKSAKLIFSSLQEGRKIILCGNGGSASDAQHIAAEFIGRYKQERASLPAIALNTDTSALTAIANDYGYENVFKRQFEGLFNEGDVLVTFTTSGNSENIIKVLESANQLGCKSICFTGESGGRCSELCSIPIKIPSETTAFIQEMHIICGHIICDIIDNSIISK